MMQDFDRFFLNESNTGPAGFDEFERALLDRYEQAVQMDADPFHFPILFYESAGALVGYYDVEMKDGFIG
jgi:hypothetical protein